MNSACLNRDVKRTQYLPRNCRTKVITKRDKVVRGYSPRCLRREGYRLVN
jgi:hypothetical protein